MKRLITVSLLLCILLCLCVPGMALTAQTIIDEAGILSESEEAKLWELIDEHITSQHETALILVTVDSLGSKSAHRFAQDYFDSHGFGAGQEKNGILLLLSMEDRDWAVVTNGQTASQISNRDIDHIMDEVLPYLEENRYYDGFVTFIMQTQLELVTSSPSENAPLSPLAAVGIGLLVGAAAGGITLLVMRSGMKTVKPQHSAMSYLIPGSYRLNRTGDFYLYSTTTRTPKPQSNSSGGSRGGRSGKF